MFAKEVFYALFTYKDTTGHRFQVSSLRTQFETIPEKLKSKHILTKFDA